jgi:hypothetical protein
MLNSQKAIQVRNSKTMKMFSLLSLFKVIDINLLLIGKGQRKKK